MPGLNQWGFVAGLVGLVLLGCGNGSSQGRELPLSPSAVEGQIQYSAAMIPESEEWNAVVTMTNIGPVTASVVMGCGPRLFILEEPGGHVVWPDSLFTCTLSRPTYTLSPGEEMTLTAHGPYYSLQEELAGRDYHVFVRVELLEPYREFDLVIGWVELEWLYPEG